jgi:hypothetical protein
VIELAYADTSQGDWLIFYGPYDCAADFEKLNHCFRSLRDGAAEIVLSELSFVKTVGELRLIATGVGSPAGVSRRQAHSPDFIWSQSSAEWDDDVGLMEGLTKGRGHGHQYLSGCPSDEAIVVASLGEYERGRFS